MLFLNFPTYQHFSTSPNMSPNDIPDRLHSRILCASWRRPPPLKSEVYKWFQNIPYCHATVTLRSVDPFTEMPSHTMNYFTYHKLITMDYWSPTEIHSRRNITWSKSFCWLSSSLLLDDRLVTSGKSRLIPNSTPPKSTVVLLVCCFPNTSHWSQ
jgi:hypothetical protein